MLLRAPSDGTVEIFRPEELLGRWLQPGQVFCQVMPTDSLQVIIPLDEQEARLVRTDQPVSLRVYAWSGQLFSGRVSLPPVAWLQQSRDTTARQSHGSTNEVVSVAQKKSELHDAPYEVELEVQNPDGLLRAGMTGRARIHCGSTTIAGLVREKLRGLLVFDLQM